MRLTINRRAIRANGTMPTEPVTSILDGNSAPLPAFVSTLHTADGEEVGRVVYRPARPLSCGARLWVETMRPVDVARRCGRPLPHTHTPRPCRTIIHVNQHVARRNVKHGEDEPPITVKSGKRNRYGHTALIAPGVRVAHDPADPALDGSIYFVEAPIIKPAPYPTRPRNNLNSSK